jgi:phosphoribosylaminoimidazole carboxylase PurE protein
MLSEPLVSVVMGSSSDQGVMEHCLKTLDEFAIPYEVRILSAHRMPEATLKYARNLAKRGVKVVVAGAGRAAHLPGAIAANTTLPVIGIPLSSPPLEGLDALYSILQMPTGVPVACMAIGKVGAKNAAIMAAQILSLESSKIEEELRNYKVRLARGEK